MAAPRVTCEKCNGEAVVVTLKGTTPMKVDESSVHVLLTVRCPKCGERKQARPVDDQNVATPKRAYLSH
jgi:hypothetical protein